MNRFFGKEDKKVESVGSFKIPRVWWSRPYEYAFAIEQLEKTDTILDVGCGLEHPFKHYAGETCKKVVALDINPLVADIKDDNVEFVVGDILDYKTDLKFDKVFLLSTFEQTKDYMIEKFENIKKMLAENGKVIITSDYPSLDPAKIIEYAEKAGLIPAGECNFDTNDECIFNATYKLHCYALILEVNVEKEKPKKIEERKTKVDKPKRTKPTAPSRTKKG